MMWQSRLPLARTRPAFVVFEGLDGVGKSTAARVLAERIGARLFRTPDDELAEARALLEPKFEDDPDARMVWYAASVARVSRHVRQLLDRGTSVVVDRYWLSTRVYGEMRGARLSLSEIEQSLVVPDITVFLQAPLSVRAARIAKRGINSREDAVTLDPATDRFLHSAFNRHAGLPTVGRFMPIDTSACEPNDLALAVSKELGIAAIQTGEWPLHPFRV